MPNKDIERNITEEDKTQIKAAKVNKSIIESNISLFYSVIDKITKINLNQEKFDFRKVYELLNELSLGCKSMTDSHCRVLWLKGEELGLTIDETCEGCDFFYFCIQNPANKEPDRLYYNITAFWSYLIEIRMKKVVLDRVKLQILIDNIKSTESEVDSFKDIVKNWDK